jgi:hypothetical protein
MNINKLLLVTLLIIVSIFSFMGCSSNQAEEEKKPVTINYIIDNNSITEGRKLSVIPTESNTAINILDCGKISNYEDYENIVYLDMLGPYSRISNYLNDAFYITIYDKYFNPIYGDGDIHFVDIKDGDFRVLQEFKKETYSKAKFIVIGGLDRERNDSKDKMVFDIIN